MLLILYYSSWLLRQLPLLPHFPAVRPQVVQALRQACQVENDPALVSGYIYFLALHTVHDSLPDLADLVLVSWLLGKLQQCFAATGLWTTESMSGHVMKMRTWCFGVRNQEARPYYKIRALRDRFTVSTTSYPFK